MFLSECLLTKDKRIRLRISERQYKAIQGAADDAGLNVPSFIRNAISMAILRGSGSEYSEITLSPKNSSSIDKWFEWLCSRQPTVSDFIASGGELQPELKLSLYKALPKIQARRFEKTLKGVRLEVIGLEEGCSRQAVHASIKRAIKQLRTNNDFAKALCAAMPDAGIEATMLIEATKNEQK